MHTNMQESCNLLIYTYNFLEWHKIKFFLTNSNFFFLRPAVYKNFVIEKKRDKI